ncbi:Hypothetical protein D9617_4g003350 [Elsinoe fawcettii]|nr:Hypothetical protein D9617_4g003350 [Elsinoe fawcettii]
MCTSFRLGIMLLLSAFMAISVATPLPNPRGIGGVIVKGLADGFAAGASDAWAENRQEAATAKDNAASAGPKWKPKKDDPLFALALAAGIKLPSLLEA